MTASSLSTAFIIEKNNLTPGYKHWGDLEENALFLDLFLLSKSNFKPIILKIFPWSFDQYVFVLSPHILLNVNQNQRIIQK